MPSLLNCGILLVTSIAIASTLQEESLIMETALGRIKGHYKYSYDERIFSAFEGIPYAKPPIGDLRFAEPQSAEPWSDILETTKVHECSQPPFNQPTAYLADKNEDCLYINVYVPRAKPIPKENLDVVVHIHGGGFIMGHPNWGGPQFLMDRDIVYVNFNYRLGIFGFLSTGDEVVPGNMGLKDQVLALKWVKNNIEYFGGNPNSVTIAGLSAGGVSVHFHYFSPLSRGLFHRGISHSGTALAPAAMATNPLENVVKLGKAVGCIDSSTRKLIECLKTSSAQTLCEAILTFKELRVFINSPFLPVVEQPSQTAFLTDHPYNLLKAGIVSDLPWLSSITTDEGMYFLNPLCAGFSVFKQKFSKHLPTFLSYNHTVSDSNKPIVADKIKKFYFENFTVTEKEFVKLCGDRHFGIPFANAARMQAKITKSPVYTYIFGYKSIANNNGALFGNPYDGVPHGADGFLLYQWEMCGMHLKPLQLAEADNSVKNFLVDTLISFAKDGNPNHSNIHWEPIQEEEDFGYLFIKNKDEIGMKYDKEIAPTEFWNSLPIDEFEHMSGVKDEL